MRTETIKIYKFNELDKEVQKRVLDRIRDSDMYNETIHFLVEDIIANHVTDINSTFNSSLEICDVYYSTFRQGAGACADINYIDLIYFLLNSVTENERKEYLPLLNALLDGTIYDMNIYTVTNNFTSLLDTHSRTRYIDYGYRIDNEIVSKETENLIASAVEYIQETYRSMFDNLHKEIEDFILAMLDDENVIEYITSNELEFTEDGAIFED